MTVKISVLFYLQYREYNRAEPIDGQSRDLVAMSTPFVFITVDTFCYDCIQLFCI